MQALFIFVSPVGQGAIFHVSTKQQSRSYTGSFYFCSSLFSIFFSPT